MKENQNNPKAWQLEIDSEIAQQRYVRAMQLAQEARTKFADNVDLRMQLVVVYRLRKKPKADRIRKIGEAWRPYRTVACWYLWRSLDE